MLALYEQQRRFKSGDWDFDGTLYSRASYIVAKKYGKLRRSPARGRWNTARGFDQRFSQAVGKLVKKSLCEWRSIRTPDAPAEFALGYKRHKGRSKDVFLTPAGLDLAEIELRKAGHMASGLVACTDTATPIGPLTTGLSGCDD